MSDHMTNMNHMTNIDHMTNIGPYDKYWTCEAKATRLGSSFQPSSRENAAQRSSKDVTCVARVIFMGDKESYIWVTRAIYMGDKESYGWQE